jgi:hypothetical protein
VDLHAWAKVDQEILKAEIKDKVTKATCKEHTTHPKK